MRPTPSDTTPAAPRRIGLLIAVGLAFRLLGLLVYGMHDMDEMLLDWGASVRSLGLADAFGINYGVVSYSLFGLVFQLAELIPRFWWIPYKLLILGFDVVVLALLFGIASGSSRRAVVWLYWLNPWFILHEAWLGFWEAPHLLTALLAVLALRRLGTGLAGWLAVGVLLGLGAMVKPQGLVYFAGPVGLVIAVLAVRGRVWAPLAAYAAGIVATLTATGLWLLAIGGTPTQLLANYGTALTVMPSLSNGGPGIWRAVTHLYMAVTGQVGHVSAAHIGGTALAFATEVAGLICLALLVWFALRLGPPRAGLLSGTTSVAWRVLLVLGFGALVMSQFGVRAHINHTYSAMVVLIPLALKDGRFRRSWIAMSILLGACHFVLYGFGQAVLLPEPHGADIYPHAQSLVAHVTSLPAYARPDAILAVQAWLNRVPFMLPGEFIVTLLSPVVFLVAIAMTVDVFRAARDAEPDTGLHG